MEPTNATPIPHRYCALPPHPVLALAPNVDPNRAAAIRVLRQYWAKGTTLKYYFLQNEGTEKQKDVVRQAWRTWKQHAKGLTFVEVFNPTEADIRIGFQMGKGSWSFVGTYNQSIDKNERTMNFGWDITQDLDTACHEIGHAIGLEHEHQNPKSGIVWNEKNVYQQLRGGPNFWSDDMISYNILRKLDLASVEGSDWDPNSIMHYPFEAGLILEPAKYANGLTPAGGLSAKDKEWVSKWYPNELVTSQLPVLDALQVEAVDLKPGQERQFRIVPTNTAFHVIQTLGSADTLLVLYQDKEEGDPTKFLYLTADDDSGSGQNAMIRMKLEMGLKYVLLVKLYSKYKSGNFGLVMSVE